MISFLKKKNFHQSVEVKDKYEPGLWIDVLDPTEEEIKKLVADFKIPLEFIQASLDERERPRVDKENGWRLIIWRVPIIKENDFSTMPLGIIVNKNKIFTVYRQKNEVIRDFVANKIKNFNTGRRINFLLKIFKNSHNYFNIYVEKINKEINLLEKRIYCSQKNEDVLKLLEMQKTLVYFNKALLDNDLVLKKLSSKAFLLVKNQEDEELLEDLMIEQKELLETLSIFNNILSNTMDAYASIISNNLNIVMKFLTSFTIILSIPNIIFSFYGMNINLPFQQYWWAAGFTLIFSLILMLILVFYFNKKNYF